MPDLEPPPRPSDGAPPRRTAPTTAVVVVSGATALAPILGRSPLQRHWGQLAKLGFERCIVLTGGGVESSGTETRARRQLTEMDTGEMTVTFEEAVGTHGSRTVLWVRGEGVYDKRLYEALLEVPGPAVLTDRTPDADPCSGTTTREGALPSGSTDGVEKPVGLAVGGSDGFPELGTGTRTVRVADIPVYLPPLRRELRPYWCLAHTEDARRRAADLLLDSTQKGVLDFPARFIHPPLENALTRILTATPVTPNQVTVLTGVLGFAAAALFARGVYVPGLVLAFLVNVLDGVDGKLARVELMASRFGDRLDHTLDVLFEFAWYLGLGWGLRDESAAVRPLLLAITLIGVMLGARGMSGIYKLVTNREIHDHRAFDRAFRLVAGRRNVYVMVLIGGLLVGRIPEAFTLCFVWGVLTLLVYTVRTALEAVRRGAAEAEAGSRA